MPLPRRQESRGQAEGANIVILPRSRLRSADHLPVMPDPFAAQKRSVLGGAK